MRVVAISLHNFRSYANLPRTPLGRITVLVGANNSGKSSILRALYVVQQGLPNMLADIRIGSKVAKIGLEVEDLQDVDGWGPRVQAQGGTFAISAVLKSENRQDGSIEITLNHPDAGGGSISPLPGVEPRHVIVPYMSKRKTASYLEDVRYERAVSVGPDMSNLAAKLSRLANPSFPGHELYRKYSLQILGFVVTAVSSVNGQRPGVYMPDRQTLHIDQMGDGVPNIVGLLADLALSERKVFLVEEPENDLHPKALKALLELIVESSKVNQFVVSTHSNIVLRHLGSEGGSLVYRIAPVPDTQPQEASISPVGGTAQDRLELLAELGYSFSDFDLWDGWLILEESSAERIIRDYLIPWFAPKLSRLRLLSAGGTGQVEPTFADFRRMVLFAHLERAYKTTSWVRVDDDASGRGVIERLRSSYKDWLPDRFGGFPAKAFEHFYPKEFSGKVEAALAMPNRDDRRKAKKDLLDEVIRWLDEDEVRGRSALGQTAALVVDDLRRMERELLGHTTPSPAR